MEKTCVDLHAHGWRRRRRKKHIEREKGKIPLTFGAHDPFSPSLSLTYTPLSRQVFEITLLFSSFLLMGLTNLENILSAYVDDV